MVSVNRRENESNTALIRRFTRRVQRAGIILEARKQRFFQNETNKAGKRRAAARRERKKSEYEHMYKMGKLDGSDR